MSEYLDNDEVLVGTHHTGVTLYQGANTSIYRNYCAKCNKNIHCFIKIDPETKEATVTDNCSNDSCKCRCRTHYVCKKCGRLHPYTQPCTHVEEEVKQCCKETNDLVDRINAASEEKRKEVKPIV